MTFKHTNLIYVQVDLIVNTQKYDKIRDHIKKVMFSISFDSFFNNDFNEIGVNIDLEFKTNP